MGRIEGSYLMVRLGGGGWGGRECMRKSGKGMVAREITEVKGEEEGTRGRRVRKKMKYKKQDLVGGLN